MRKRLTQFRACSYAIIFVLLGCAAVIAVMSNPRLERMIKTTEPFHSAYLSYSKWENGARRPSEVGEGKPLAEIYLSEPMGIEESVDGTIYFSDRRCYVWSMDQEGNTRIVAGTGVRGMTRVDVPARECHFGVIQSIRISPNGELYIADGGNHMILRIDRDGIVRRVLGVGYPALGPAKANALEMPIFEPHDLCFGSDGTLYVTDVFNHRILGVDSDGQAKVVAGTGKRGFAGDGGPATHAMLRKPYGLAVDSEGRLLIADSGNNRIRRIEKDGTIHTIAGTGKQGYRGDDGPAAEAEFNQPQSMVADRQGGIYVSDEHNHCIRYIASDGCVRTIAGTGQPGTDGDDGPATKARIYDPEGICLLDDGSLLIAQSCGQIRQLTTDGHIRHFAGQTH